LPGWFGVEPLVARASLDRGVDLKVDAPNEEGAAVSRNTRHVGCPVSRLSLQKMHILWGVKNITPFRAACEHIWFAIQNDW
jgi:hypothetical protein